MPTPRPILVLGPTAGGKSALAAELAETLGGEVISADSMQVYRELDRGTAKPPASLRARIPHHLVDVVDPGRRFTVSDWLERAEQAIEAIRARGRHPIVTGGTHLYVRALLEGLFDGPPEDPALRRRLGEEAGHALHERLAGVDPEAAARIHPHDRRRLVRALEVYELTGRPMSAWQGQWREARAAPYRHDPVLLGLRWPREALHRRINERVRAMFHPEKFAGAEEAAPPESLPEEVRRLETAGRLGPQAREALGYKQVLAALAGSMSMEDAMERTKIETRRFARQQRTWLKRFRGVRWLEACEPDPPLLERALAEIEAG